jgi:hypothetical protein
MATEVVRPAAEIAADLTAVAVARCAEAGWGSARLMSSLSQIGAPFVAASVNRYRQPRPRDQSSPNG